ncbi:Protein of unknown function [Gryllus bimaculatus]|nr:Protein of unknown function [Gryllus bimaculatus]
MTSQLSGDAGGLKHYSFEMFLTYNYQALYIIVFHFLGTRARRDKCAIRLRRHRQARSFGRVTAGAVRNWFAGPKQRHSPRRIIRTEFYTSENTRGVGVRVAMTCFAKRPIRF